VASTSEVGAILASALLAGLLAIWGVITQRIVARRQSTLEHLARADADRDMIAARKIFIELTTQSGGLQQYAAQEKENTDEVQAIRLVLNDMELMSIGVQFGALDLQIIKRYAKGTIIRYWFYAVPFVYAIRLRLNAPSAYHEFEELARWMQDNKMPHRRVWLKLLF